MAGSRALTDGETEGVSACPADLIPVVALAPPPAPMHAQTGSDLGRYLVIEELGRGPAGNVLRAYDPKLQREVALRCVLELSSNARARLLHESRAMGQLSHPNVLGIYDVEASDEGLVIAMEYVRGTTLEAWLAQPRSWAEIVAIFIGAGRGLAAAHAIGLFHRTFGAKSVLVGSDGRPRVTGFGLSDATQQRDDAADDAAADQYAFCLALWEGLTGQSRSVAPASIRKAINRGLAPDANERWPSMEALLEALVRGRKPRQRLAFILAGTGAAAVFGVAFGVHQQNRALRCTGARDQVASIWDEARREDVRQAMLRTGLSYAEDMSRRVTQQLDAYTTDWTAMHTEACEATTIHHLQPREVMDLRMACLHRSKVELRAATDLLVRADAQVVEKAAQLIGSLPALARCADVEALQAAVAPPLPAERDAVEAARVELAEARALRRAGKYDESLEQVRALAERTEHVSYAPLRAEVSWELGASWDQVGKYGAAEAEYRRSFRSALRNEQWSEAAIIAIDLVDLFGRKMTAPDEAFAFAETARGLLQHAEPSAARELRSAIGETLQKQARYGEAEVELVAALTAAEAAWGREHLITASYRSKLATNYLYEGKVAEAEQALRAVLAAQREALGDDHPSVSMTQQDLAYTYAELGRYAEAEAAYRTVLSIYERGVGLQSVQAGIARRYLASAILGQGRHKQAEAEFREALKVLGPFFAPENVVVLAARSGLAQALSFQERHAEAEVELRNVLATATRAFGSQHPELTFLRPALPPILTAQGRFVEAEREARDLIVAMERVLGRGHPGLPTVHHDLGVALQAAGRAVEAEAEFRIALELADERLGAEHAEVAWIRSSLGHNLHLQGRHEEAEPELRQALKLQLAALRADHPRVVETRARLERTLAHLTTKAKHQTPAARDSLPPQH